MKHLPDGMIIGQLHELEVKGIRYFRERIRAKKANKIVGYDEHPGIISGNTDEFSY